MRRKRLICAIMALVLLLSAAPSALAAGTGKMSTTITATPLVPTINVVVPAGVATLINPLSLPVSIGGTESTAQVISTPGYMYSLSNVPLSVEVGMYATIKTGSTMKLASSPTYGIGYNKEAFLYFEMIQSDTPDTQNAQWAEKYSYVKHIAIANKKTINVRDFLTLPAATKEGKVAEKGYALYRIAGDAVTNPSTAWNSNDGVNVLLGFTFTPVPYS